MIYNKLRHKNFIKNTLFFINKRFFLSLFSVKKRNIFVSSKGMNNKRPKFASMSYPKADRAAVCNALKVLCFVTVALLSAATQQMQAQGWEVIFGGSKEDQGKALVATRDGGFLVAGYSESFGLDNDMDVYLIRTDVDGRVIWSNVYDEAFIEHAYDAIQVEDGGFLIVGDIVNAPGQQPNVYLLKVSANGKQEWSKQYGNAALQRGYKIAKGVDGGYVITGVTKDTPNGENNVLLIRVDDAGNELWSKNFGRIKADEGRGVVAYKNGYAIASTSVNILPGRVDQDIIVYRVDAQGEEIWQTIVSTFQTEEANDIIATRDGGLAVAGQVFNNSDALILKLDENGLIEWQRPIDGGSMLGDIATAIVEMDNGDLVITGVTEVTASNLDVLLARVDKNGTIIRVSNLGDSKRTDWGEDIVRTQDGGFAISGYLAIGSLSFINDVLLIKTDAEGNTITNYISGRVFYDRNNTCGYDLDDQPLKDWLIKVTGGNKTYFGTTDAAGYYRITVDTGRYNVNVLPPSQFWESCIAAGYNVNLTNFYDTTSLDFPVFVNRACPYLEVDIATPFLTVCSDVVYNVSYCNIGTMRATDAYVEVMLDDKLRFISSSIPFSTQQGNKYTFPLGNIGIAECGSFKIETAMACSGIAEGQAALVSARIFPDTLCLEPGPNWDGSSIIVGGNCEKDTVSFFLKNVGRGDMTRTSRYYVVQEDVMLRQAPFQLGAGQEQAVFMKKSEGATYRIIAEQSDDHPGRSFPTLAIEGCVEDGQPFTTGYVLQFPEDDRDNFIDIDVQEILGSVSDVFMRGYPKGYADSLITNNTEITYKIVFKNNGTDTLSRVVIRDTLSQNLDIATFVPGAASHPYRFEIYDSGILKITFENLNLLPGGSAQETSNWGYINFRIAQKPNNPTGTLITNSAAIYFNFDAPVQTNTWRHVVGEFPNYVITAVQGPVFIPGVKINVRPNPFAEFVTFEMEGQQFSNVHLSIFDMAGRRIDMQKFTGNQFMYYRNQAFVSGMYIYKLETSEGQLIGSGKLMIR